MTRERLAAAVQMAGLSAGVAAGFVVDEALGLLSACVSLLLVGLALERR